MNTVPSLSGIKWSRLSKVTLHTNELRENCRGGGCHYLNLAWPTKTHSTSVMQLIALITCSALLMLATDSALALANGTVREVDGLLYITEPINTFRMTRHIQLWAADLHGDVDKLDVLMASGIMNDLSLLMATVNQMATDGAGEDSAQSTGKDKAATREEEGNTLRRFKRNIIGDVLHFVSGVPTDEMMAKQVKLDEEIRDKVTATLTRQMAYERSVTDVIGNITREEEVLGHHLEKLAKKHTQDVSKITRFATHRQVILDDIDKLEDILEALWTGVVNTRHAVYLSSRAGLKQVATFRTVGITAGRGGPTVRYVMRLYKATTIMAIDKRPTYNSVATLDRLYTTSTPATASRSPSARWKSVAPESTAHPAPSLSMSMTTSTRQSNLATCPASTLPGEWSTTSPWVSLST
jgi:hypothetical protein